MVNISWKGGLGWCEEPQSRLRREQPWSVLQHRHWLPGRFVIPTIIVTPHTGLHELSSLHIRRKALPDQHHPDANKHQHSHACHCLTALSYVCLTKPETPVHALYPVRSEYSRLYATTWDEPILFPRLALTMLQAEGY
jgi:hypothetical protein